MSDSELADIAEALERAGLTIDPAAYDDPTVADSHCDDCGTETWPAEYFMVLDELWQAAGPDEDGFLCVGCLETRLGRQLHRGDFTSASVNDPDTPGRSDRLRDRLTRQLPPKPVRRASEYSACGNRSCTEPIRPRQEIVKPPGRPWQHLDCLNPRGQWQRGQRS